MGTIISLLLGNKFIVTLITSGIAIFGALMYGRSKGKKTERDRQNRARQKTNRNIDQIEEEISGRSLDELRSKLKRWSGR